MVVATIITCLKAHSTRFRQVSANYLTTSMTIQRKTWGVIFAQHYPRENQINIALADFGIGIPITVRTKLPNLDDNEAIIKAVESGFTVKSTAGNRGELVWTICSTQQLTLTAVVSKSCRSVVMFCSINQTIIRMFKSRIRASCGYCPGTTIDIRLRTDTIEELDDTSERPRMVIRVTDIAGHADIQDHGAVVFSAIVSELRSTDVVVVSFGRRGNGHVFVCQYERLFRFLRRCLWTSSSVECELSIPIGRSMT